ncbi:hypothetical protein SprV_0501749300 [Sparganum proliferum]
MIRDFFSNPYTVSILNFLRCMFNGFLVTPTSLFVVLISLCYVHKIQEEQEGWEEEEKEEKEKQEEEQGKQEEKEEKDERQREKHEEEKENEEEGEGEEGAALIEGAVGNAPMEGDDSENSGHNRTMQFSRTELRRQKFVPELEAITEVSEEEEAEVEEEEDEVEENDDDDDVDSVKDKELDKKEEEEENQETNECAAGVSEFSALSLSVDHVKLEAVGVVGEVITTLVEKETVWERWQESAAVRRRRPPRWRNVGMPSPVHVSDQQSAEVSVRSGVPQGSVHGPTLFLVYVNDCANQLDCDVAVFADDIKIWSTIRNEVDEARLQTNLDHLEQWSKDWLLPFNVNKCNFLRVGGASSPNRTVYRLTGKLLQEVDAQKGLGVWITTSLKPSLQCSEVAKSAMSILYLVKRAFSYFDEDCFAMVFQTFVRPHLEFAVQAWRPWTDKDLGILEKVQR